MAATVAVEVARAELRRAGTSPHATTGLARVMMGLSGIGVLAALSWLMIPGPGLPTSREGAVRTLWVSVSTAGVFWACGRWWARARLRNRARHIAMGPNLSPGLWAPDSWTEAGVMIGFLCFMTLVFGIGSAHRASGKETAVGTVMMVIAVVFTPVIIAAGCLSFWRYRQRGGSRFVPMPNVPHWLPGQDLAGVLEVQSWFGGARAVRFELVETTHEHTDGPFEWARWKWRVHVAASVTVRAEAFENPPGLIVVPMTIAIPADAAPQGETMKGAWFAWQRFRAHTRSWSLRATAVEGSPAYEAEFAIAIVAPGTIAAA
jgi:hypothetical protein